MRLFGKSKRELLEWQNMLLSSPSKKLLMNEKELQLKSVPIAENCIRIAKDSSELCETTKKPDVFFSRYDLLIEHTEKLAELSKYMKFKGISPVIALKEIKEQRESSIKGLIDRCLEDVGSLKTDSAKIKRYMKLLTEYLPFKSQMSLTNWDYLEGECVQGINRFIETGKAGKNALTFNIIEELNKYVYQAQSYINAEYDLTINPYYLVPSKTEYKKQPLTKTGKSPKYPTCFSYATPDVGREQFGEAWLLPDGSIGKARMITWINRIGYQIHLAEIENTLKINKIEFTNAAERNSKWKVIYKA